MTDIVLPPALKHARSRFRYIGNTGISRGAYNGVIQTTGYGGDRVGASIDFTAHGGRLASGRSERAQLMAFMMAMRAKQNRVWATDSAHSVPRGSFPAPELFSNTEFSSTTGWNNSSLGTVSTTDNVARLTLAGYGASSGFYQSVSLTQNVPYALRSLIVRGRGLSGLIGHAFLADSAGNGSLVSDGGSGGYLVASAVATASGFGNNFPAVLSASTGMLAGDYLSVPFTSLSRCIPTDGGGNLILPSDEFGNAAWTKSGCSVLTDVFADATGVSTMDAINEDGANAGHYTYQDATGLGSAAADYMLAVVVAPNFRNYCVLTMQELAGTTAIQQFFDLTGSGSVGVNGSTGAGWANRRAHIVNLGANRFLCILLGRKTSAATSLRFFIGAASADGTDVYTGNNGVGGAAIGIWRATAWPTAVPSRLVASTDAAVAAQTQTGFAIHVKGLPVSTSGLLLVGDWIEVDGQLKMVTAPLNSDAAGMGYLQFSPPLYREVSDNTPIIVHKPMGRFILASDFPEWSNEPGVITTGSLDLEEAFA